MGPASRRMLSASFLLYALCMSGCATRVKELGGNVAGGAADAVQLKMGTPEMHATVAALTRAATIGAMDSLSEPERKAQLRGVAEEIVDALTPKLRAALKDELGPEIRAQVVSAVHSALIAATSGPNKARLEDLAAGVTGAVVGQLGPDHATAIRIDLGPAIGDAIQDDLGPAMVVLTSQMTATALDEVTRALDGALGAKIDHVFNRGEEAAAEWRSTFIITAIVLGCLMVGSGVWLRIVYRNLKQVTERSQHQEQALSLVAGAIKNHEGAPETRAIVDTVKELGKDTPAGEVIRGLLAQQPHLKVQRNAAGAEEILHGGGQQNETLVR